MDFASPSPLAGEGESGPAVGDNDSAFFLYAAGFNATGNLGGLARNSSPGTLKSIVRLGIDVLVSFDSDDGTKEVSMAPVSSVLCGDSNAFGSVAIQLTDGSFFSGGKSRDGALYRYFALSGVRICKVSMGKTHALLLSNEGEVFSFLYQKFKNLGQLGILNRTPHYAPTPVYDLVKIRDIAAGYYSSCFVTTDGDLLVCGPGDEDGSSYFPFEKMYREPEVVCQDVARVFTGNGVTFIQKVDRRIYAGGYDYSGQAGVGFKTWNVDRWVPVEFEGWSMEGLLTKTRLVKITSSLYASFLLLSDGTLFSCGRAVDNGFSSDKTKFTQFSILQDMGEGVTDVSCGSGITAILSRSGTVYLAGAENKPFTKTLSVTRLYEVTDWPQVEENRLWVLDWHDANDQARVANRIRTGSRYRVSVWNGYRKPDIFIIENRPISGCGDIDLITQPGLGAIEGEPEMSKKYQEEISRLENQLELEKKKSAQRLNTTVMDLQDTRLLTLFRSFHNCLIPFDTPEDLAKFAEVPEAKEFLAGVYDELFKGSLHSENDSQVEWRFLGEKITDFFEMYRFLKKIPETREYFKFFGSEFQIDLDFGILDRVCSNFLKSLGGAKKSPYGVSILFAYFDESSFEYAPLVSKVRLLVDFICAKVPSTPDGLDALIQSVQESIFRDAVSQRDPGPVCRKTCRYLRGLGARDRFWGKFAHVMLALICKLASILLEALEMDKTQEIVSGMLRRSSKMPSPHWIDSSSGVDLATLQSTMESLYLEVLDIKRILADLPEGVEKERQEEMLLECRRDLLNYLVGVVMAEARGMGKLDVLEALERVFLNLGIIEELSPGETTTRITTILLTIFGVDLDTLMERLLSDWNF